MSFREHGVSRVAVLGALVVVGALPVGVVSGQQGQMEVEVEQLQDNLYVLRGGGGNSAAFVTSDGVVLVDTKVVGFTYLCNLDILFSFFIFRILAILKEGLMSRVGLTVGYSGRGLNIINTHAHFDHVSGNVEFPATVEFVAHDNAKTLMEEWNPVTGFPGDFPAVFETSGGQGLPTRTYQDRLTLGSGADQVDLYYFGRGHTGGDTWVGFPALRTMHAGDMFPGKQVPIMDASNGGSGLEYANTLRMAYSAVTDIDTIITGHSVQMDRDDLREMADFVDGLVSAAKQAKAQGVSAPLVRAIRTACQRRV